MGVFFDYRRRTNADGRTTAVTPKPGTFIAALILLAVFAALAWLAETQTMPPMPVATAQLWAAFRTVLTVVIGFLAGEAVGALAASSNVSSHANPRA